jgi:hypothetical protein
VNSQAVSRNIWLPRELAEKAEQRASNLGQSLSNVVADSLFQTLSNTHDPLAELLKAIRIFLTKSWDPSDFPPHVTIEVFRFIERSPSVMKNYKAAAKVWGTTRVSINRRIGRCVTQVLDAVSTERRVSASGTSLVTYVSELRPRHRSRK